MTKCFLVSGELLYLPKQHSVVIDFVCFSYSSCEPAKQSKNLHRETDQTYWSV